MTKTSNAQPLQSSLQTMPSIQWVTFTVEEVIISSCAMCKDRTWFEIDIELYLDYTNNRTTNPVPVGKRPKMYNDRTTNETGTQAYELGRSVTFAISDDLVRVRVFPFLASHMGSNSSNSVRFEIEMNKENGVWVHGSPGTTASKTGVSGQYDQWTGYLRYSFHFN